MVMNNYKQFYAVRLIHFGQCTRINQGEFLYAYCLVCIYDTNMQAAQRQCKLKLPCFVTPFLSIWGIYQASKPTKKPLLIRFFSLKKVKKRIKRGFNFVILLKIPNFISLKQVKENY